MCPNQHTVLSWCVDLDTIPGMKTFENPTRHRKIQHFYCHYFGYLKTLTSFFCVDCSFRKRIGARIASHKFKLGTKLIVSGFVKNHFCSLCQLEALMTVPDVSGLKLRLTPRDSGFSGDFF
jgi:hypothetical protein